MIRTRIVVGVDGSAGATAAVRWAAVEARRREAELRVLAAYHRDRPGTRAAPAPGTEAVLHAAVTLARSEAPGVEVRCLALPGYAVPVLLHAAETADLLVVGARATSRLPGLPSGSVSAQVATHAKRSVVVVRGHAPADGPVLAGADDGPDAGTVVGRAFEEAALRDAPLVAITARAGGADPSGSPLGGDPDGLLDPWREKYPGVTAHREIVTGRPDVVLTERTANAQLVVVGPRRHGFEGVLLGAVGSRLLRHAGCPVLIARP